MSTLAGVLLALSISADFEGGRIGKCEAVAERHFRCSVPGETDQDGRNRQASWYYFRLNGAAAGEVTIDLVDLPGEYNYRPNAGPITPDTLPAYSYDGRDWQILQTIEYDKAGPRYRMRLTPKGATVWIARLAPYTNQHLAALLDEVRRHPHLKVESIGKTPEKRDLQLLTITDPGVNDRSKKVIWLMARQHSWESMTSWVAEGTVRFLLSDDAAAQRIRREAIFKILPMADPDGVARGGVRFNGQGYDLNRNWDTIDPKRTPEIYAQHAAITGWMDRGGRIDLFLSMHNTETGEYLEGPPDTDGKYKPLLERFYGLLRDRTTFVTKLPPRSAGGSTTPGKPGRMTVVQGLYRDRKIPAFLTEQMVAANPKLGRVATVEDRKAFGAQLAQVMFEAVR
jgi:hypothetical protein